MKRFIAVFITLMCCGGAAYGGEIDVVNPKAAFPEGPVWHGGKLYYAEYGAHTVTTWDGKTNIDSKGNMYIGQYSSGRIVVVDGKGKLVKVITVPSPAAPNLAFGAGEDVIFVMAVDDVNNAPYHGKVYRVEN